LFYTSKTGGVKKKEKNIGLIIKLKKRSLRKLKREFIIFIENAGFLAFFCDIGIILTA